jgi:hypothetical protein
MSNEPRRNPMYRESDDGPVEMTPGEGLDDLRAAYVKTHGILQRLTFLLEEKGSLTREELAYLYEEGPKPVVSGLGQTSEEW